MSPVVFETRKDWYFYIQNTYQFKSYSWKIEQNKNGKKSWAHKKPVIVACIVKRMKLHPINNNPIIIIIICRRGSHVVMTAFLVHEFMNNVWIFDLIIGGQSLA